MLAIENNGDKFSEKTLLESQKLLADCVQKIAQEISPGMTEKEGIEIAQTVLKAHGFGKNWHPPKVRFGTNTMKTFADASDAGISLQTDDLFFLDLGPILADHECDFGQTFMLGNNDDYARLRDSAKILFERVKTRWKQENLSGQLLYQYAADEAAKMGYEFVTRGASGHRVGDFPHHIHYRGNLLNIHRPVAANRWILEIQIHDVKIQRGAFFEDIL